MSWVSLTVETMESTISQTLLGATIADPRVSKLGSKITTSQMVDGVDEFYKDWRNRKVLLRDAMQYVEDEANGKDDSKLLLVMRQRGSERKK
jgi:hypothetical protein